MDSRIGLYIFKKRLAETIAWCSERVIPDDPAQSLRSTNLRPPGLRLSDRLGMGIEIHDVVKAIVDERASLVKDQNKDFDTQTVGLAAGRLLLCFSATESIPDGYVTASSKGFYDADDMPPWDTWICYLGDRKRQYLVSWVPPAFIELANVGVEKHFMDCIRWATQEDTYFTRQLKSENLLG